MARKLAFDQVLFTAVIILVGLGLTMVYSASAVVGEARATGNGLLVKQCVAAALGLAAMWIMMHVDYRRLARPGVAWGLYGLAVILLLAALLAPELNSTRRWLTLGGFSFQPSELAKLALVVLLARHLGRREDAARGRVEFWAAVGVGALLALLVLVGRDLGSAVMLTLITGVVLFVAGAPLLELLTGVLLALPAVAAAVAIEPYRRRRLLAFLEPERYADSFGFQPLQSLIAIGSGGVFGLGLGQSVQKLYFLPYPHSDFVFAIVGEELGLVGATVVLGLFVIVFWRGAVAGWRAPDGFGRILAWGLTASLAVQALLHVSVSLSLLPATGITLPFVSYGGSSLVLAMTSAGMILNVSQHG